MHKTVLILLVFIFITTSYLVVAALFLNTPNPQVEATEALGAQDHVSEDSAFGDLAQPIFAVPIKVSFNETSLDVEKIGLEPDGQLQVPSAWDLSGWYRKSAKPGEKGNVIIDGHFDTDSATPAAFWGLKNVKVNDTVTLQDELKRDFSYRVVDTFYVDITDPQRPKVFEETGEAELTLVTCGGVWDATKGTYDKRLVIKAVLAS